MPNAFTWIFLAALAAATGVRLWLAQRQIRHVRSHRAQVPQSFATTIPLAAHQKAADYTVAKARLGTLEILIGAAALLALTLGGLTELISATWARVLEAGGIAHGTALIVTVAVMFSALELPVTVYRTFVVEARYGFNRMTPALFIADLAKQALLGALLGIPLLVLVLWLMGEMGAYWWLYVWLAWAGFNLLVLLIYPTFIAPLFNKFTPLADPTLAGRIEALLARCGFRSKGLYVMDGSKRSNHGNAYFTGFGASKRIVLFDTLLARLAPPEVEAVLAHELGHYRRHHVWKRVLLPVRVLVRPAVAARRADRPGLVLPGPERLDPDRGDRTAAFRAGDAGIHVPPAPAHQPLLAQARVRGRCLRRGPRQRGRAGQGAGQAVPRQRGHADAGPAALGVLRLAPAGGHPHRAAAAFRELIMEDLTQRKCKPCEGGVAPYTPQQAAQMLGQLKGWLIEDGRLVKLYPFSNYYQTMAFVNALAWVSHREDHHPDLTVGYNKCRVEYSTHAIGGLSENDFICAAKCDALFGL